MKIVLFISQIIQEKIVYNELFMMVMIGYILMYNMVKRMQNSDLEIVAGLTRLLTYQQHKYHRNDEDQNKLLT